MLRANLSSRPFYNERLVSLAIAGLAAVAIALAAFSVYTLSALAAERSDLKARIARDSAQAQQIESGAVALQRSIDRATLLQLAASTQEANALIDERTFSWTAFFSLIEKTLPLDLRLVSVAPRVENGQIRVTMTVVGRKLDDIDAFVNALQDTGAFSSLLPKNTQASEDDHTLRADVVGFYHAQTAPEAQAPGAAPAAAPAPAGKGQS